jgi:tetratricopeptide (TPR) repeat protein
MIRLTALCLVFLAAVAVAGDEPTARDLHASGQAALEKADFEKAASFFRQAAKAEPDNKVYARRAMILSRVLKARKYVQTAKADAKWETVAISLRAFYVREGLLGEAVKLDRKVHAARPSAKTAELLAETLLEAGRNEEALKHIAGLAVVPNHRTDVLLGIAQARTGKMVEAKAMAKRMTGRFRKVKFGPGLRYDFARLQVLIGEKDGAIATLTGVFADLPTKSQAPLREAAKQCPDFKAIAATPAFAKALATPSKVTESDCSGGSGCGSCPEREKCGPEKKSGS